MVEWFLENWPKIAEWIVPLAIALTTFLKNANKNQKETQESIKSLKETVEKNNKETNDKVDALNRKFEDHIKDNEDEKARQARMRILRFYDELCADVDHSESFYEDILDDCQFYEGYCEKNKEFKNHRGQAAIEYIDKKYREEKQTGGFLKHA